MSRVASLVFGTWRGESVAPLRHRKSNEATTRYLRRGAIASPSELFGEKKDEGQHHPPQLVKRESAPCHARRFSWLPWDSSVVRFWKIVVLP